ncbi:SDR family NAD(P)-dependent oxidoreductase [Pseudomonas sp. BF-R-19]|uniref:SDR family NAD(P)-dependent oxidoreductase n=1 Tax=Pseudomonas sp. BF-R-19 TaxID=2832397 RepID=UPI001CBFDB2C|nr:SDR family oxidoreductase [Pseudomonas sp. BF-R-19]
MTEENDFPRGTALVVGASGGVGGAISRALAQQGSDVVLCYRSSQAPVEAAAEAVRLAGRKARVVKLDLQNAKSVKQAVNSAVAEFGQIHTVVYAAGPQLPLKWLSTIDPGEMAEFLNADTMAFFNLMHASIPALRSSRGSVVAIHTCGLYRWPNKDGLSVVPKAAIEAMIKGFAREEGSKGVRVNGIALGVLDGGLFHKMTAAGDLDESYVEATRKMVPLGRLGHLEEVAHAAVFLASSRAAYITGHSIVVDGGFHL